MVWATIDMRDWCPKWSQKTEVSCRTLACHGQTPLLVICWAGRSVYVWPTQILKRFFFRQILGEWYSQTFYQYDMCHGVTSTSYSLSLSSSQLFLCLINLLLSGSAGKSRGSQFPPGNFRAGGKKPVPFSVPGVWKLSFGRYELMWMVLVLILF